MPEGRSALMGFLLLVVGLFGLAVGLCGGVFTGATLWGMAKATRGGDNYGLAVLVISFPSLLIGTSIARFALRRLKEPPGER